MNVFLGLIRYFIYGSIGALIIYACLCGQLFNKAGEWDFSGKAEAVELGQWLELKGKHFVVYYLQEADREVARTLSRRAEEYYNSIGSQLGYTRYSDFWTWDKRAKIMLFPDKATFVKTTGQPEWSIGYTKRDSKVFKARTIVTYKQEQDFYEALLPHEISHLILHDFIPPNMIPAWFDEGVAQLQEEYKSELAGKIMFVLLKKGQYIKFNVFVNWDIRKERDTSKVTIFYAQSLSVVEFLIKKYGSDAFGKLCRNLRDGKSLEDALRGAYTNQINSVLDLEKKWIIYMKNRMGGL